jgi:DNA-binding CsgD family transcriptional regulator
VSLDHLDTTQAFDTMATALRLSSVDGTLDAVASAAAAAWFAVIEEEFCEATSSVALARRHLQGCEQTPTTASLIESLEMVVRAFSTGASLSQSALDELFDRLMTESDELRLPAVVEVANWFTFADRYREAAFISDRQIVLSRRHGDHLTEIAALACHAELDLRRGRWYQAIATIDEALRLSAVHHVPSGYLHVTAARVTAAFGNEEETRGHLRTARRHAYSTGDRSTLWRADAVEALDALGRGEHELAAMLLRPLASGPHPAGGCLPSVRQWDADLIEALVAIGEVDEAQETLGRLSLHSHDSDWAQATELRCVALTGVDRAGNPASPIEAANRSAELFDCIGAPFERARSELIAGEHARATGDHRGARASLRRARTTFDGLHAESWSRRAERSLGHAAPTSHVSPATTQVIEHARESWAELTDQESELVRWLATGASNREIAARLFVSVKTVEAHLTRIYRKRDVSSRTQLLASITR